MTPKEKAKELYGEYFYNAYLELKQNKSKQCALMTVDKIMSALTYLPYGLNYLNQINYWDEVKQEIEKL
jgi:hypothetical protein